ncbi:lymphoid enhancer-binding factor 1-like isoform X1 [Acipenser oxyrinchus oxyrinchus]|uniref:Lymphoid enhancer-binding factor 1-like isoform X1 n=1 Tax=Acipenser oxyrinchus oxyrinchus TaxID=40147 RepID=A0AAD8CFH7_ACIOX|nr:lymphoid enhancer-binding factor 1-like isoform X1 [Acipenser oxyrinchus oxyrinchus]
MPSSLRPQSTNGLVRPLQITLLTVPRRKKKCIRYLQGGGCASPDSSDGSAIDSPLSPTEACPHLHQTPEDLAGSADSFLREQTPFNLSANTKPTGLSVPSSLDTRHRLPTTRQPSSSSSSSVYSATITQT